jgi:uncharacterized membrane protein YkvA (DUF1232 family)
MAVKTATGRRTIFNPAIWGPVLLGGLKLLVTRDVPWYCKALVAAAIVYAVTPFDFDFFPVVGWMDDVAVVLGLLSLALSLSPSGAVKNNPMEKATVEPVKPEVVMDVPAVEVGPARLGKDESDTRGR